MNQQILGPINKVLFFFHFLLYCPGTFLDPLCNPFFIAVFFISNKFMGYCWVLSDQISRIRTSNCEDTVKSKKVICLCVSTYFFVYKSSTMSLMNDSSIETLIEEIEKRPALYKKKLKTIFRHELKTQMLRPSF
jgi:hypothetical protein